MPYLGVVLAGGRSRRMGYDKALIEFGGTILIDYVLCRLSSQLDDIIVNSQCEDVVFSTPPLLLIRDREPFVGLGPLSGVYAALHYVAARGVRYSGVITVAVDTPFFPSNYVARLFEAAALHPHRALIATSAGKPHPTFALWPLGIEKALVTHLQQGDYAILSFAKRVGVEFVDFPPKRSEDVDAFFNINTPQDLQFARKLEEEGR